MFSIGPMGFVSSLGVVSIVVLLTLFFFSVASWAVIVQKWRLFRSSEEEEQEFLHAYELRPHDSETLRLKARHLQASPSAMVYLGVMDRVAPENEFVRTESVVEPTHDARLPDRRYLERVVEYIVQSHMSRQETYLPFLATTGNITPFIGLLGTVLGIINAFGEISIQGTASIAAVAPGVAEALVATAAGLFAAIPAVIAYNYFLTKIRKAVFGVEAFSIEFLNALQDVPREIEVTQ